MLKNKKSITFFLIIVLLLIIYINKDLLLNVFTDAGNFISNISNKKPAAKTEEYIDAEKYYANNAEIIAAYDAKTSDHLQTEKQISEEMNNRGFADYPVSFDYSMEGEYIDETELDDSEDKHPSYQTTYISSNGELWSIIVINGCYMANPVSFNLESELGVQLIVSESDIIMCYDGPSNTFFETIPDESALLVKTVEKINAETLDILTVEVLKNYETK